MAQLAVRRPLGERDLRDEAGRTQMRVAHPRRVLDRGALDAVLVEPLLQLLAQLRREAGADLARVAEPSRPRRPRSAARRSPPARSRSACSRRSRPPATRRASASASRRSACRRSASRGAWRSAPRSRAASAWASASSTSPSTRSATWSGSGTLASTEVEQLAPLLERPAAQVLAVEPEEIEGDEALVGARLVQALEARAPRAASSATISPSSTASAHRRAARARAAIFGKRPERSSPLRVRNDELAAGDRRERAVAVVLHLEEVPRPRGRARAARASPASAATPSGAARRGRDGGARAVFCRTGPRVTRAAATHRLGPLGDDVVVRALGPVLRLEEEPLLLAALRRGCAPGATRRLSFCPASRTCRWPFFALRDRLARRHGVEGPRVPDERVAGAVLAVGDAPLELAVLERVVLGLAPRAASARGS